MSFNINNWGRWSVSYNSFPPNEWAYTGIENGEADTIDVMKVDGFFDNALNFLKIGHLIYLEGLPIAPTFPSRELVVVTGVSPVTVKPLVGIAPLQVVIHSIEIAMNPVGLVQVVNLTGLVQQDFLTATIRLNPQSTRILSILAETDQFTLTFDANPGIGLQIQVMAFRGAFFQP
jgi:hypothetical protein